MKRHFLSKRLFAILAVCSLLVTILCAGLFQAAAASESFVDDLTDLSKVSSKSDGLEIFPDHAEHHESVIGKPNDSTPRSITYKKDGKVISAFTLTVTYHAGFKNLTGELGMAVRLAGSDTFTDVEWTEGAVTDTKNDNFKNVALTPKDLASNVEEVKFTLKNPIGYTLFLNKVELTYDEAAPAAESFVDDLTDLSKVSSKSDGLEIFPDHAEHHESVIGKPNDSTPRSITYKKDGKVISAFTLTVTYHAGFKNLTGELGMAVRLAGSDTFTDVEWTEGAVTDTKNDNFKNVALTPKDLASNVEEVKFTLKNPIGYTLFLNKVELTYVEGAAAPTTTTSQEPTTTTTQEPTTTTTVEEPAVTTTSTEASTAATTTKPEATTTEFVDDFTTNDKMSDKSEGWDLFADHAETHLSVLGKKSAAAEYVSYKMSGNTISDFALSLQMANGFFELDRDVKVEVRASGSDTFTQVELQAAEPVAITGNATFSTVAVSLKNALPADTEEVKITLLNDVAWTLFLDQVRLTYVGEGATATTGGSNESPSTGAAFPVVPALLGLTAVAGAGIVLTKKKQG